METIRVTWHCAFNFLHLQFSAKEIVIIFHVFLSDIAELRKKFEEDKQRIALLRAQRKFRPY